MLAINPEVTRYRSTPELVNALMTGRSATDLELDLLRLSNRAESQAVFCTCCTILDEVGKNCQVLADEVTKLLTRNCELFEAGHPVCRMGLMCGMEVAQL